jgi:hypothetical protein
VNIHFVVDLRCDEMFQRRNKSGFRATQHVD